MDVNAVGTGAYKLLSITPDVSIEYERNDEWWKVKAGLVPLPAIRLVHQLIDSTATTTDQVLALEQRDVDAAAISTSDISQVEDISFLQNYTKPSFIIRTGMFNVNDTITGNAYTENASSTYNPAAHKRYASSNPDTSNAAANPFTALDFRQAWSLAFDYETYVTTYTGGLGQRLEGVIPEGIFGHINDLNVPQYIYI